jgi:hypothetical protein
MADETLADKLKAQNAYKDLAQYNSLKESAERERVGVREYYEHLKRHHGDQAAREIMKQRGYNLALLK